MLSRARTKTLLVLPALAALAGCPDRPVSEVPSHPAPQTSTTINIGHNNDLDLLFVIDNSGSMGDEQASLLANFGKFMDTLSNVAGGLPNLHIGVVSSDVGAGGFSWGNACVGNGDDGLLQATPHPSTCSAPSGNFIEDLGDPDGTRHKNYNGTLADTFSCIANLGTGGCGFEHHMESMKRALDGHLAQNNGFFRKDAWLAVVFIADEDDCSAKNGAMFDDDHAKDVATSDLGAHELRCTEWAVDCDGAHIPRQPGNYTSCVPRAQSPYFEDPTRYGEFLRSLKPDHPELIVVGGIVGIDHPFGIGDGDPDHNPATFSPDDLHLLPSCGTDTATSSTGDGAVPPVRFKALIDSFGVNGVRASICENDLTPALTTIAELIGSKLVTRCLPENMDMTDLHPELPGEQPDCSVYEQVGTQTTAFGRCKMLDQSGPPTPDPSSKKPCWYVDDDADHCSGKDQNGHSVGILRDGTPDKNAVLHVDCVGK